MRLVLVSGLVVVAWGLLGPGRAPWLAVLALALVSAAAGQRGSARIREATALLPVLVLWARLVPHVAYPAPPRLLHSLAALTVGFLALALALARFASAVRALRVVVGLSLSLALTGLLGAVLEVVQRWRVPLDTYALVPEEGSPLANAYAPDPELDWVLQPGFRGHFAHPEFHHERIEINADGFRDAPWPEPEAAAGNETAGILMLGDSTLFGLGVDREETIPALLQGLLQRLFQEEHPERAPRVYNSGVPGYGPRHERLLAERLLTRLHPRLCVQVFYDGNDLEDCRLQFSRSRGAGVHQELLPSERLVAEGDLEIPDFVKSSQEKTPALWSRVYWWRYSAFYRELERRVADTFVSLGWMPVGVATNNGFLRAMQLEPDPGIRDELALAFEAVREVASLCEHQGIPFLFVRLPGALQAEPTSLRLVLERLGQEPRLFDRRRPGSLVLEEARKAGAHTLDLLPLLEVGENSISPFYFREGHPNRDGNARIARALLECIQGEGLLEPDADEPSVR